MSIGLLFIAKTPGYNTDIMSYLFGNILMISQGDLTALIIVDIIVLLLTVLFYQKILAVCFDSEFAMLRGVNTKIYHLLLLIIISVSIVFLIRIVGIVMVIAMLTLPAAIAGEFVKKLWKLMFLSIVLSVFYNTIGIFISFHLDLPTGPTIIFLFGLSYLFALILKKIKKLS